MEVSLELLQGFLNKNQLYSSFLLPNRKGVRTVTWELLAALSDTGQVGAVIASPKHALPAAPPLQGAAEAVLQPGHLCCPAQPDGHALRVASLEWNGPEWYGSAQA